MPHHPLLDPRACFACLAPLAMNLRFDKRGRPYLTCTVCGTQLFMRHPLATRGLHVVMPFVQDLVDRLEAHDPETAKLVQQRVDVGRRSLTELVSLVRRGGLGASDGVGTPADLKTGTGS